MKEQTRVKELWKRESSTRKLSIAPVGERKLTASASASGKSKPNLAIVEEKEDEPEEAKLTAPTGGHGGVADMGYVATLIHLLKGNIGAGLFGMADAFFNCGILLAPLLTLFLATVCIHSQHLLLYSAKEMQKKAELEYLPTFAETIEMVFQTGPGSCPKYTNFFKIVANIFICLTQLGFCCIYIVFIADNAKQVMENYGVVLDVHVIMVVVLVPILLSAWIRDLKYLVPVSLVADVFMFVGIIGVLYMISIDVPSPENLPLVAPISRIPLYIGITIFSFEGISLVLPLSSQMKKPKNFSRPLGVLNMGMVIVTTLLITMGTLGYIKYGDQAVQGSITLNLPQAEILSQSIKLSISTGIMLTYAIQFYVPVIIIWPPVEAKLGPFKYPGVMEIILRSVLVLLTFFLAEVVPYLGIFVAFIGAFCSTALALLFPAVLDTVTRWQNIGWLRFSKNVFLILVGVVGFLTGTYASIVELVKVASE